MLGTVKFTILRNVWLMQSANLLTYIQSIENSQ